MSFGTSKVLCSVVVLLFTVEIASGIRCYQCSGTEPTNPFQCNEYLDDNDMEPMNCDSVYGAQYCIKHVGRFEGGIGTKRFCSPLDLGNYCNYVKQTGDTLEYRSCVYTCTGDGCNSSVSIKPLSFSVLCSLIILFHLTRLPSVRFRI